MEAVHKRVAGIDVHRMKHVVTILIEQDGAVSSQTREFGGFKRDMRALVAWLQEHRIQHIVMESTGIYWKSVFSHLEAAGLPALVVNAFHVKNVPGRKTDVSDSEWLAQLARFGLLRGSFIPPKDLRELRVVSRYRRKLTATLAGEKNRLHKLLDDAGIKLGGAVADIDGVCARRMVESNAARRTKTVFRAKYESLVIRRGYKKTIIAIAHKLIRTIYIVLDRRKPYRDSAFDYEAASVAKNAPRWIRALKKYGYWPQVAAAT